MVGKTIKKMREKGVMALLKDFVLFLLLKVLYFFLPSLLYEKIRMYRVLGYWPNIEHPRSFNEKVTRRILYDQHPLSVIVADKWKVRDYVDSKGLGGILNDIYWAGDNPEIIPFDDLPSKYVIKANHGCGWNLLVRDSSVINNDKVIRLCNKWLGQKLSDTAKTKEKHYDLIHPMIIVEKFIEDKKYDPPIDFKLHCFHGQVHFIRVFIGRGAETQSFTVNKYWEEVDVMASSYSAVIIDKPKCLEDMVAISEILSADFDFVRVDLYSPNDNTVVFGELTLTPAGGTVKLKRDYDFEIGKLW